MSSSTTRASRRSRKSAKMSAKEFHNRAMKIALARGPPAVPPPIMTPPVDNWITFDRQQVREEMERRREAAMQEATADIRNLLCISPSSASSSDSESQRSSPTGFISSDVTSGGGVISGGGELGVRFGYREEINPDLEHEVKNITKDTKRV